MLHYLRRAGLKTTCFGYFVSRESFADIRQRLSHEIVKIAEQGEYVLIGHSLGGVLIRAAVEALPEHVARPNHVFLLGSPQKPARLAKSFTAFALFRALTQDCGALLASDDRMADIGRLHTPVTSIVGVKGIDWRYAPFYGQPNDGIVAVDEVSADWLTDQIRLPIVHGLLPSSRKVAQIILAQLGV